MGSRRIKHDLATEQQQWQDDVGDGMEELLLFQNNKRIEPSKAIHYYESYILPATEIIASSWTKKENYFGLSLNSSHRGHIPSAELSCLIV